MKYALITRPRPEAIKLKKKLQAIGISGLVEPILKIEVINSAKKILRKSLSDNYQAIVITSINGVKAFIKLSNKLELKRPKFIVIGKGSEDLLKKAGFSNVVVVENDVEGIKNHIIQKLKPSDKKIIYISGNVVTADLESELYPKGYKVRRIIVYKSLPTNTLSNKVKNAIKTRKIKYALFYSSRTASVFNRLINESDLNRYLDKVNVFCFSNKVAKIAGKLRWKSIHVPRHPNEDELLSLVKTINKANSYED